jgi:hypothetical protein
MNSHQVLEVLKVFTNLDIHSASGLSVDYGPSNLVVKSGDAIAQGDGSKAPSTAIVNVSEQEFKNKQALATGLPVGMRFNSFKVLNQACARPWHFQERLKADGRKPAYFHIAHHTRSGSLGTR